MDNWKEQFDNTFEFTDDRFLTPYSEVAIKVKDFISSEIIEKLINDIPETTAISGDRIVYDLADELKQELRSKWL